MRLLKINSLGIWKIIMVLVTAGLLWGCTSTDKKDNAIQFPDTYRQMDRAELITGQKAINGISRLHGTDIKISQGYQVTYQGAGKTLIIWISESPNAGEAEQLLQAMNNKMSSNKTFTGYREENISGRKVYYVYGMNMDNYYYRVNNRVYWIAVNAPDPVAETEAVLKDF